MRLLGVVLTGLLAIVTGCSEPTTAREHPNDGEGGGGSEAGCSPGETPRDGDCIPAGDGAGIEVCGEGFAPTSDGSCTPILPEQACPEGMMALLGETRCHEILPCGDGPWGDVAIDGATEHVDGAFDGASDGSAAAPWTTIQSAVDAAAAGATVAVAAGTYLEDVIVDKPLTLSGRCPSMVTITGVTELQAVWVTAAEVRLRGLAITGPHQGIRGAAQTDVESVWVHDVGTRAIVADAPLSVSGSLLRGGAEPAVLVVETQAQISNSVIAGGDHQGIQLGGEAVPAAVELDGVILDDNTNVGIFVHGSSLTMSRTLVRGTRAGDQPDRGWGLHAQMSAAGERPAVTITESVFESNTNLGVNLSGANAVVTSTVIRGTQPNPQDESGGTGLQVRHDSATGTGSTATITQSVMEKNRVAGVFVVGSEATLDRVIVRDTLAQLSDDKRGRGITGTHVDEASGAARLTILDSLVERNREIGVTAVGMTLLMESTAVVDTQFQQLDGLLGRGLQLEIDVATGTRSRGTVRHCVFHNNMEAGVTAVASDLEVFSSLVGDTQPTPTGSGGWGIVLQHDLIGTGGGSTGVLSDVLVERSAGFGIALGDSSATVVNAVVRETASDAQGFFGDGLLAWSIADGASLDVASSTVEGSSRAGISGLGATMVVTDTDLRCNGIHLNGGPVDGFEETFTDGGGNHCTCGEIEEPCKLLGVELEPPAPLGAPGR